MEFSDRPNRSESQYRILNDFTIRYFLQFLPETCIYPYKMDHILNCGLGIEIVCNQNRKMSLSRHFRLNRPVLSLQWFIFFCRDFNLIVVRPGKIRHSKLLESKKCNFRLKFREKSCPLVRPNIDWFFKFGAY